MPDPAKFTVIGGKNVGKTCFMHGMYAVLRRGVNNYFLHAENPDDDVRLMQGWAALNRRGKDRRWPVPTNTALARHQFAFKRGINQTMLQLEWVDYRGGALLEDSESAAELLDQLQQSDCLLFCLDGGELREPLGERVLHVDHRMCISRAKVLMDKLPKRVPMVVVITKHDMCLHRPPRDVQAEVERLFDAWLIPGEGWEVMLCPVTLGNELARDRDTGEISPRNLHLPVIYAVFTLMLGRLVQQEREARRALQTAQAGAARVKEAGGGNFLMELWRKDEVERAKREHEALVQQHKQQQQEVDRFRHDIALLGRELSKAVIYSNGEKVLVG